MRTALLLVPALGLLACAGSPPPTAVPSAAAEGSSEDATSPAPGPAEAPVVTADGEGKGVPHPLVDDRAPDPARSLPRLSVKHVGLHVGGGDGSAGERKALLDALEAGQLRVLDCYRFVDQPALGGTFGVDLYVGARGGSPEVRALRHKLGGEGFEGCMVGALGRVSFGPQVRPIVVSYSLRFELSP